MRLIALSSILLFANGLYAESTGALSPPGLLPLISRANALLSSRQFSEAAKAYSEAIEQSPVDYVLYYKRATAYFSLSRHSSALDDFDKVLSLTSNTFDNALLMKARIHVKDGRWTEARDALKNYSAKVKQDETAAELLLDLSDAEMAAKKAVHAQRAQLWTACTNSATQALRSATHSLEIRQRRAECSLAAGEIESAVGDLTRLLNLSPPSTSAYVRTFRFTYFYLPTSGTPLSTLKQCLHFDPDSKPCLTAHRTVKKFDKLFTKLEKSLGANDWRGIITLLVGKNNDGFLAQFEEAMKEHTTREKLLDSSWSSASLIPLPSASKASPRREQLLRAVCRAYTHVGDAKNGERWCDALLQMDSASEDADGLVGKAEAMLVKEEWEEAVRLLEKAFEASERSDRDIHQRLQKAQRLLKQSRQKDYYKVLSVSRDADAKTIKKAYRKAVLTAHPDKGGSEAKMATVNEAYEVLSNPELRQRFDDGDDPNDPTSQGNPFAGGHGDHPFAQFFQNAGGPGGGGFQFHFSHHGRH